MPEDLLYRRDLLRLAADVSGAGRLPQPDASATETNPACGDRVTIDLALTEGRITELRHDTKACVLAQASAALLAQEAAGQDRRALRARLAAVEAMLKGGPALPGYAAFQGAAEYPGRHVCVLLPLRAALAALEAAS